MGAENPTKIFPEQSEAGPNRKSAISNREIETKIVNLGDPEILIAQIIEKGGTLETARRRIRDIGFNLDDFSNDVHKKSIDRPRYGDSLEFSAKAILDLEKLQQMLKFLGFKCNITNHNQAHLTVVELVPRRTMRIRQDGHKLEWTAKTPRINGTSHDDRREFNVPISEIEPIRQFLSDIGYIQKGITEKDRVTYKLGECSVEINYGPAAPPWGEIEGPSEKQIFEVGKTLGYSKGTDLVSMSDGEYYRRHGVTNEQLKKMIFPVKQ